MFRLKALNETEESSNDSIQEEGRFRKPTREALEVQAKNMYQRAFKLVGAKKFDAAADLFLKILSLPFICDGESGEVSSALRHSLQLGCAKSLSFIYYSLAPSPSLAALTLSMAIELQPTSLVLHLRLGEVCLSLVDFFGAAASFSSALDLSPSHWGALEKNISLSFLLRDYGACLDYCARGLRRDRGFLLGLVFRDEVLRRAPYFEKELAPDGNLCEIGKVLLSSSYEGREEEVEILRIKSLSQVREWLRLQMEKNEKEWEDEKREKEKKIEIKINGNSWAQVAKSIRDGYDHIRNLKKCIFSTRVNILFIGGEGRSESSSSVTNVDVHEVENSSSETEGLSRRNSLDEIPSQSEIDTTTDITFINNGTEMEEGNLSQSGEAKERRKKHGKNVKWWQLEGKRRSERVRGNLVPSNPFSSSLHSQKRDTNGKGIKEKLQAIIPPTLLIGDQSKEELGGENKTDNSAETKIESYWNTGIERADVRKFILKQCTDESISIFTIVENLVKTLAQMNQKTAWPKALAEEYIKLFTIYRTHKVREIISDNYSQDKSQSDSDLEVDLSLSITYIELLLDSHSTANKMSTLTSFPHYLKEVAHAQKLSLFLNLPHYVIRLLWHESLYHLLASKNYSIEETAHYLKETLAKLEELASGNDGEMIPTEFEIRLPTSSYNIISIPETLSTLQSVEQRGRVRKSRELYEKKDYETLVLILSHSSASERDRKSKESFMNSFYLADSYYQLKRYREGVEEVVDLVKGCLKGSGNEDLLIKSLILLKKLVEEDSFVVTLSLARSAIPLMLSTLAHYETIGETSLSPYFILHSLLFKLESAIFSPKKTKNSSKPHEEEEEEGQTDTLHKNREEQRNKLHEKGEEFEELNKNEEEWDEVELDPNKAPPSLLLLQMAHDELGRNGSCSLGRGKLLSYTLDVLLPLVEREEYSEHETYTHTLEQAVYCLYGHPEKIGRVRYLKEHESRRVPMEMKRGVELYKYYKRPTLPEFDSYESIGSEEERLFLKILRLFPSDKRPQNRYAYLKEYLAGKISQRDEFTDECLFEEGLSDIFYLLGDHYFKMKKWSECAEYYTWDLGVDPNRFDSWAALALSKAESLSSSLNSGQEIGPEELLSSASVVISCFNEALTIRGWVSKLRIEFGSFLYSLHSYCSRLVKQRAERLSLNLFRRVEEEKESFLRKAAQCFEIEAEERGRGGEVGGNNEEEEEHEEIWIHHYMQGKVMEKLDPHSPIKFLEQYEIASKLLSEQKANYPLKISFYSPQYLAIEALEIYYRIHASILNYVEKHDYDAKTDKTLMQFIERAEKSPFMLAKLKRIEKRKEKLRNNTAAPSEQNIREVKTVIDNVLTSVEEKVESEKEDSSKILLLSLSSSSSCSDFSDSSSSPLKLKHSKTKTAKKLNNMDKTSQEEKNSVEIIEKEDDEIKIIDIEKSSSSGVAIREEFSNFKTYKYGTVVAKCIIAMEECISRFPQHHKSYYRISHAYATFVPGLMRKARDWLLGTSSTGKARKKIIGLFSERKPNNFFNGIWRSPVGDIDRPGSFPYHMSKCTTLLLDILTSSSDYSLLASLSLDLGRTPEPQFKILPDWERESLGEQAASGAVSILQRSVEGVSSIKGLRDIGVKVWETYLRVQKGGGKENFISGVLGEVYRKCMAAEDPSSKESQVTNVQLACRYFQKISFSQKTSTFPKPANVKIPNPSRPSPSTSFQQQPKVPTLQFSPSQYSKNLLANSHSPYPNLSLEASNLLASSRDTYLNQQLNALIAIQAAAQGTGNDPNKTNSPNSALLFNEALLKNPLYSALLKSPNYSPNLPESAKKNNNKLKRAHVNTPSPINLNKFKKMDSLSRNMSPSSAHQSPNLNNKHSGSANLAQNLNNKQSGSSPSLVSSPNEIKKPTVKRGQSFKEFAREKQRADRLKASQNSSNVEGVERKNEISSPAPVAHVFPPPNAISSQVTIRKVAPSLSSHQQNKGKTPLNSVKKLIERRRRDDNMMRAKKLRDLAKIIQNPAELRSQLNVKPNGKSSLLPQSLPPDPLDISNYSELEFRKLSPSPSSTSTISTFNTSPFRTGQSMRGSPSSSSELHYALPEIQISKVRANSTNINNSSPPAAHSSLNKLSSNVWGGGEPEIIDLTNKSPDKSQGDGGRASSGPSTQKVSQAKISPSTSTGPNKVRLVLDDYVRELLSESKNKPSSKGDSSKSGHPLPPKKKFIRNNIEIEEVGVQRNSDVLITSDSVIDNPEIITLD